MGCRHVLQTKSASKVKCAFHIAFMELLDGVTHRSPEVPFGVAGRGLCGGPVECPGARGQANNDVGAPLLDEVVRCSALGVVIALVGAVLEHAGLEGLDKGGVAEGVHLVVEDKVAAKGLPVCEQLAVEADGGSAPEAGV